MWSKDRCNFFVAVRFYTLMDGQPPSGDEALHQRGFDLSAENWACQASTSENCLWPPHRKPTPWVYNREMLWYIQVISHLDIHKGKIRNHRRAGLNHLKKRVQFIQLVGKTALEACFIWICRSTEVKTLRKHMDFIFFLFQEKAEKKLKRMSL